MAINPYISYIRIHLKVIHKPTLEIDEMLNATRAFYHSAGLFVDVASLEHLELPALYDIHIAACKMGRTTEAQRLLFNNRNHATPKDIVVYFIRSTIPYSTGCAAYPPDKPGLVITTDAGRWTLAHEIGHLLGLSHVRGGNYIMTQGWTVNIVGQSLKLTPTERFIICESPFAHKF